jgi:Tol biopolymer transport system component
MAGTLAAIIKDDPRKVSELAPTVPLDVERVITRCLRKEPERRYQSMADLRVELLEIQEAVDSGRSIAASQFHRQEAPALERKRKWFWGLAVVFAVGIGAWIIWGPGFGGDRPPQLTSPVLITSFEGYETQPALSPDGRMVAFAGYGPQHGPADIFVKLVDEGEPLQLTSSPADDRGPTWSHDGTKVAFSRRQPDGTCGVMEVSALGGPERRLTIVAPGPGGGCGYRPLDYSPDGRFLAMRDGKGLTLLSLDTGDKMALTDPPDPENDRALVFSPDGRKVAFIRDFNRVPGSEIRIQPVDGGASEILPFDEHVNQLDWAPSGKAIVCAHMDRGLWWVPLSGKEPTQLEVGDDALHVSIASAAEPHPRMVFTERGQTNSNIYQLSGPTSSATQSPAKLHASTRGDFNPDISPDGTKIAFRSSRAGANGIWVCAIGDDESCFELSERGMTPRWSPDGKKIAYRSKRGVWVMDADGGIPVRLTEEDIDAGVPAWSADGKWIYFGDVSVMQLWKMPAEGGEAVRVTKGVGGPSRESEDGRFLYFWRPGGIWRVPTSGGEETSVVEEETLRYFNWTLWNDKIIYSIRQGEYGTTIRQLDPKTQEETEIASLEAPPSDGLAVSPDGQWLYVVQVEPPEGDLMLVDFLR